MSYRRLYITTTSVGNSATTSEETLHSFTIPARTLVSDGDAIRVQTWVRCAANNNANKLCRILLGGGVVMSSTAAAFNNVAFVIEGWIFRTGAGAQKAVFTGFQPNVEAAWSTAAGGGSNWTTPSLDETGTIALAIRGQSGTVGAANDVLAYATIIDYFTAA